MKTKLLFICIIIAVIFFISILSGCIEKSQNISPSITNNPQVTEKINYSKPSITNTPQVTEMIDAAEVSSNNFTEIISGQIKINELNNNYNSLLNRLRVVENNIRDDPKTYNEVRVEIIEILDEISILNVKILRYTSDNKKKVDRILQKSGLGRKDIEEKLLDTDAYYESIKKADTLYDLKDYSKIYEYINSGYSGSPLDEVVRYEDNGVYYEITSIYSPYIEYPSIDFKYWEVTFDVSNRFYYKLIVPKYSMNNESIDINNGRKTIQLHRVKQIYDKPEIILYKFEISNDWNDYYLVTMIKDGIFIQKVDDPFQDEKVILDNDMYKKINNFLKIGYDFTSLDTK